jgi:hypothetical protein
LLVLQLAFAKAAAWSRPILDNTEDEVEDEEDAPPTAAAAAQEQQQMSELNNAEVLPKATTSFGGFSAAQVPATAASSQYGQHGKQEQVQLEAEGLPRCKHNHVQSQEQQKQQDQQQQGQGP